MPRRLGLPSVYLVATAVAAAVTTAAPLAVPVLLHPASGLARRPAPDASSRPYLVTARDRAAARDLVGEVRWRVRRYYTAALPGFATWLTADEAVELRADPRVHAVEPDRPVRPLPGTHPRRLRAESATGRGTTVYVLGSGLDVTRGEFGGRAWRAFDATGGGGDDCTGHGTQVARQVGGSTHGVAPHARLASVRVLGCGGTGNLSDVVAGLDWVRRHAKRPAVAALPVGGAASPALAAAVRRLTDAGILVTGPSDLGMAGLPEPAKHRTAADGLNAANHSDTPDRADPSNDSDTADRSEPSNDSDTAHRSDPLNRSDTASDPAVHFDAADRLDADNHSDTADRSAPVGRSTAVDRSEFADHVQSGRPHHTPSPHDMAPPASCRSSTSTGAAVLAGTAARHLELHPGATPSTLASWLNCATSRAVIRQNPTRTPPTGEL